MDPLSDEWADVMSAHNSDVGQQSMPVLVVIGGDLTELLVVVAINALVGGASCVGVGMRTDGCFIVMDVGVVVSAVCSVMGVCSAVVFDAMVSTEWRAD